MNARREKIIFTLFISTLACAVVVFMALAFGAMGIVKVAGFAAALCATGMFVGILIDVWAAP